jgi:hypothetical protein
VSAVQPLAIAVSGHVVSNPLQAVVDYLAEHGGTVTHYDFQAIAFRRIDLDLIRATRSPWMGSRISAAEATWLVSCGASAPWGTIPLDARLKDADPLAAGGLHDQAMALWEHFWDARPANVSTAKISKTLYLMRPGLYPILDSRLTRFYRDAARAAAVDVGQKRPALKQRKSLYGEAVRRDILASEPALLALRQALAQADAPLAREASRRLSDLRLLDILAWAASGQPVTQGLPAHNADASPL